MKNNTTSASYKNRYLWTTPRLDVAFIADLFSQQLMQLPLERRK